MLSIIKEQNQYQLQVDIDAGPTVIQLLTPPTVNPFRLYEIQVPEDGFHAVIPFEVEQGGTHTFYAWEKEKEIETLEAETLRLGGAGHYGGELHSHSTNSDGKNTIDDNAASMAQKGHDFFIATDHNTLNQKKDVAKCSQNQDCVLPILSYEFGREFGHMLAYNTKQVVPLETVTERGNVEQWQLVIQQTTAADGFCYMAHPFEAPRYAFGEGVLETLTGYTGLEGWNGYNHHGLSWQNVKARELWDQLNRIKDEPVFASAASDAHQAARIGDIVVRGTLDSLSADNVFSMLQQGSYYGTNGPTIAFSIDGAGYGETVQTEQGKSHHFSIFVHDPLQSIESIVLLRGQKNVGQKKMEKALEILPPRHTGTVQKDCYFEVEPGDFYRVEVVTSVATFPLLSNEKKTEQGFAFTNPIFIK